MVNDIAIECEDSSNELIGECSKLYNEIVDSPVE